MLRLLAVILIGWFGDLSYARVYIATLAGLCVVAIVYMLALPRELPLWPGVLTLLFFSVLGLFWESKAARSE